MVSGTNIELANRRRTHRVLPQSTLDFELFRAETATSSESSTAKTFEKFMVSGELVRDGYETFLDPILRSDDTGSTFEADVCGVKGSEITVAFCPSGTITQNEWNAIRQVVKSSNAKALILTPREISRNEIDHELPARLSDKVRIETIGWFEDTLERTLQDTLRTIELLVNETRMRMVAPLLHKSAMKRDLRARINPKLVYHNLSALSDAGLVEEPVEGTY
ncbi:MAG TPA: hypothetical protein VFV92_00595, partial [Candidatus Bathyarchaeia archaeon]|nr:hypothetical protein [Candidatus Bathyarchaeia archaeon]